jgi:hypothetical protein
MRRHQNLHARFAGFYIILPPIQMRLVVRLFLAILLGVHSGVTIRP